jgi:hypothetical protein
MKNIPNYENLTADYHLFIDIQMGKYLRSVNKNEFSSDDEAKLVIGKILQAWNDKISNKHNQLDNSTTEAKTAWFNSIDIDFPSLTTLVTDNKQKIRNATKSMINYYDNIFPFLPEGAVMYLLFAGPALEAYGYSLERFSKLLHGEKPTGIEKYILQWAYDVSFGIMLAYLAKNDSIKDKLLSNSLKLLKKELDEQTAANVLSNIYSSIQENYKNLEKNKNKPKSTKKK